MKLLAIDGNSIINRAFYGIRLLSNQKGVFTNAVTGFLNIYLKLIAAYKPDGAAAAFDLKAPTFRHKAFDGYKAGRKGMPDELAMQLPYVKELLKALGVKVIECEGYEADDILGTLAHACDMAGNECIIATGDRDSFQLITDRVSVNLAGNKEDVLYTPAKIMEVYGVTPAEMLEVKALMGDASDNIPGVPGCGEKTALTLLQNFGTLEGVYEHLDSELVKPAMKKKLAEGRESAQLSYELATIRTDAPLEFSPADAKWAQDYQPGLYALMLRLGFTKFIERWGVQPPADAPAAPAALGPVDYEEILSGEAAKAAADTVADGMEFLDLCVRHTPDYSLFAFYAPFGYGAQCH